MYLLWVGVHNEILCNTYVELQYEKLLITMAKIYIKGKKKYHADS